MKDSSTARKRKFQLKAVPGFGNWRPLPDEYVGGWTDYSTPDGIPSEFERPGLFDCHFGNRCDYGALFTYLFRRFGLPNRPSDDYKEIAAYTLSTPLKDMVLVATPALGDWPRLSFRFLITSDTYARLTLEPVERWRKHLVEWCESQGLPDWMSDWLEFWRTKPGVQRYQPTGEMSDWRLSITDMMFVSASLESGTESKTISAELRELLRQVAEYSDRIHKEFDAIEPHPDHVKRADDWREWPEEDPLKPYYAAAAAALEDLSTPVRVRDSQINAHGDVDDKDVLSTRVLEEPEVSGHPFGYYVNKHPDAAIELLSLADDLGRGNLAVGVRKILDGYAASKPAKRTAKT